MKELLSPIQIDASPSRVWQVLTDFAAYPEWNPFVVEADGEAALGARLHIRVKPFGLRAAVPLFCRISVLRPERELRWVGSMLIPGLFSAEHYFKIEPIDERRIRFINGERFNGILVGAMSGVLDDRIGPLYREMNMALKSRAESSIGSRAAA